MRAPLAQEIFEPQTVEEVLEILAKHGHDASIIAGGTDLVVKLKDEVVKPGILVDILGLPLDKIQGSRAGGFRIGATVTASQMAKSPELRRELPVLVEAAKHLGGPQTSELATVGGNICNASPSGNLASVLMALDASVRLAGPNGERVVNLEDFFVGPGKTVMEPSEMLAEVVIPAIPSLYGTKYVKHTLRREMDIAIVGVAVLMIPEGKRVKKARIALSSVGPTILLAKKAQSILEGNLFSLELAKAAAKSAQEEASYIDDVRSSAAYRRKVTPIVVKAAIVEAWAMAGGGEL
ncbi:MAG: xanthine dehydrogenase family protein subunit M [Bacillota bacterium]